MSLLRNLSLVALSAFLWFGLAGCSSGSSEWNILDRVGLSGAKSAEKAETSAPVDGLKAVYWLQQSAEYEASVDLAYDMARIQLDRALADPSWTATAQQKGDYSKKPPAVILDVDETAMSGSAYQAYLATSGNTHSWTMLSKFFTSPGSVAIKPALDFTNYAASKGVEVFYVTNRRDNVKEATRRNLIEEGFPVSDKVDTVLLVGEKEDWGSKKEVRWAHIAQDYRVLLLIGDNLGDVAEGIYDTPEARMKIVEDNRDMIGTKWIMLPNPLYGSWEGSVYGQDYRKPNAEKIADMVGRMDIWAPTPEEAGEIDEEPHDHSK
jgi:acid phosphatase